MDICSLLLPAAVFEAIGYVILWPVLKKKAKLRIPRRFSLADFAALFVYVQLVMGFGFYYRRFISQEISHTVVLSMLGVAAVVLWGASISILNQLQIKSLFRRMLFLLLLLPGTLGLMFGLPAMVILLIATAEDDEIRRFAPLIIAGFIACLAATIALRFLAAWLVHQNQQLPPDAPTRIQNR